MSDYKPAVPLIIRTARKEHRCSRCRQVIGPGERYEIHKAPPWSDGNESPHWWTAKTHITTPGSSWGIACDEARAYRDKAEREQGWAA
jgi:hypothetical protein